MKEGNFKVRRLDSYDDSIVREVVAIQKTREIARDLMTKGAKSAPDGFLISAHTCEEIRRFIAGGGQLHIAETRGGQYIGYLLSYPKRIFTENHTRTQFSWRDEKTQKAYETIFPNGDFVYLDQIGVVPAWQGQGVAMALLAAFEQNARNIPIISAIVQKPVLNSRSNGFFRNNGYLVIGTFRTLNWKNIDEIVSDVLIKILPR